MAIRLKFTAFDTRVGRRLLAAFLLSAMGPILVLSLVASRDVSRHLEQQSQDRLEALAKSTGMGISQRLLIATMVLTSRARLLASATGDSVSGEALPPAIERWMVSAWDDPAAQLDRADRSRLQEGRPVLGLTGGREVSIRIGVPVPGRSAVLWGILEPHFLWGLPEGSVATDAAETLCILDPTVQLYCPSSDAAQIRRATAEGHKGLLQWTSVAGLQYGGAWELFLGYEFGHDSWRIVVGEQTDVIREPIAAFTATLFAVVALTACIVVALSAWLIRLTLVPLRELQEATVELANHRMDHRVVITSRDADEFQDLANSFNTMASRLQLHMRTLTAINAYDRAILSTGHRDQIADVVLSHGTSLVQADLMAFALCRADPSDMEWVLTCQEANENSTGTSALQLDHAARQALVADEMGTAAGPELLAMLTPHRAGESSGPLTSAWLFPLLQDGQVLGLLAVGHDQAATLDEAARRVVRHLLDQASVALTNIRLVEELGLLHRGALEALARTIDAKSPWTAGHSERVTMLAVAIGEALELPTEDLERLYRGGLLHDIGKIGIPQDILDKAGPLTAEEREVIETHPGLGARILAPVGPLADVLGIVRHHHERWDGKGYPDRLAGRAIPRLARILAVADVYDAITSSRPYREGMPHGRVVEIIRGDRGTSFDPDVVDAFLTLATDKMPSLGQLERWLPEIGAVPPPRDAAALSAELEVVT